MRANLSKKNYRQKKDEKRQPTKNERIIHFNKQKRPPFLVINIWNGTFFIICYASLYERDQSRKKIDNYDKMENDKKIE